MLTDIHPNRIVCLSSGEKDSNSLNSILHEAFRDKDIVISRVSSIFDVDIVTRKKNSRFLRDLNITAYFGRMFTKVRDLNISACLRSIAPYKINLNSLKINVLHGVAPPLFVLSTINANLVALCRSSEPSQDRWINDEKSPFLVNDESYPECLGFGIVRAIDVENNAIYILSPLSPENLKLVNVILKGAIDIPLTLIAKFNNGLNDCPYYTSSREKFDRRDASIADYLNESIRNRSSHMKRKFQASHQIS
uniref:NOL9 C-terminal domain-containing protein n=1 Tax=Romanomermis culicivorax TaxID=13658 RepID=A0A915KJF8_ROMCU